MARLTAEFWVHAYLRRLDLANIPAFVVHRGDATAGAVIIKSNTLNGMATLLYRVADIEGNRHWSELENASQEKIDENILRQRHNDPDIWVIEVEDKNGRTLLDEAGLFD
ncbi:MAG: DUF1491 family protein [Rhodobacteraceae bacterium]|nr:DUF1491 family protein [Paracoccaceae bacterium]